MAATKQTDREARKEEKLLLDLLRSNLKIVRYLSEKLEVPLGPSGDSTWQIRSPADVANSLLPEMSGLAQEQFRVLSLNSKNRVMGCTLLYQGSIDTTLIRASEIFREAIRLNARSVVIVHNHPSGDPEPSSNDIQITGEIIRAGRLLDIEVIDHVVLGRAGYVSLRQKGLVKEWDI